ncbi:MFS transporter [Nonomuraea typhae]|uniref:MFS transporter n=1 Tax=Nonomuraea typhae TaxID=2603600 RepID=A0ABW7YRF9_9ACTN
MIFSIFAMHLGFSIWTIWSVVAARMGTFTVDQLFWLVALPNLVGALARVPYSFAPARFGGRNWTVVSVLLLLIPTGALALAVSVPGTPFWVFLLIAAAAGLGGGNFASCMANIAYFYPAGRLGWALGVNAAGGNIGVSSVQLVVPVLIGGLGLAAAGLFWVPLILISAGCAWLFMDNLATARSSVRDQAKAARHPQTWIMAFLYIGTFGSFIGYSTAFPLLTKNAFPAVAWASFAFIGPLVGSLSRPWGGWLADRMGGARVTLWAFAVMALGVAGVWWSLYGRTFAGFIAAFVLLFVVSGIGNGSTYRMIPAIFRVKAAAGSCGGVKLRLAEGRRLSAAAVGIIGAVGALGGFFVNLAFGSSIAATGGPQAALVAFALFYGACAWVTWRCYLRPEWTRAEAGLTSAGV